MKDWWNSLKWRQKLWLYLGIVLLGGLIAMLGALMEKMWLMHLGVALMVLDLIGYLILARCPHCGKMLWRQDGEYCQYCGRPLDAPDHKGE